MKARRLFVGAGRQEQLSELESAFEAATAVGEPRLVVLEAPLGWGKTRLVQELYERLAADQSYWPATVAPPSETSIRERKRIAPEGLDEFPDVPMPWMWWGISCERREAGSPAQVLALDIQQLLSHRQGVLRRGNRNEAIVRAAASAANVALGVMLPAVSSAIGGLQAVRDVYEAGLKHRATGEGVARSEAQSELIVSTLALLRQMGKARLPVVLVLDDAHLADGSLTTLLSEIFSGPMPIGLLCIATAWPDELAAQRQADDNSFGAWLANLERRRPELVRILALQPLPTSALVDLVMERAPHTDGAVAAAIARRADGNPFVLRGLLDLPLVNRSCRDGAIELTTELIATLPNSYEAILRERWDGLPRTVQEALCIASIMGPQFVRELWLTAYDLFPIADPGPGLEGLEHAISPHEWLRAIGPSLHFVERYGYELAVDALNTLVTPEELARVRTGLMNRVGAWKGASDWKQLPNTVGQSLLRVHVHLAVALGAVDEPEQMRSVVGSALLLADAAALAGDHASALATSEQALAWAAQQPDDTLRDKAQVVHARALMSGLRFRDAYDELEPLFQKTKALTGPERPVRLLEVGGVLLTAILGREEGALGAQLAAALLPVAERTYGIRSIEAVVLLRQHAFAQWLIGDGQTYLRLSHDALSRLDDANDPDGDERLIGGCNLASGLIAFDRAEEASAYLGPVLDALYDRHEPASQLAISARLAEAELLLRSGSVEESKELAAQQVAIVEEAFGRRHPLKIAPLRAFARALEKLGDIGQAANALRDAIELSESWQGPQHSTTLQMKRELGWRLGAGGDYAAARNLLASAVADALHAYPPTHEIVRGLRRAYIRTSCLGDEVEADVVEAGRLLFEASAAAEGPEAAQTLRDGQALAMAMFAAGAQREAHELIDLLLRRCNRMPATDRAELEPWLMQSRAKLLLDGDETGDALEAATRLLRVMQARGPGGAPGVEAAQHLIYLACYKAIEGGNPSSEVISALSDLDPPHRDVLRSLISHDSEQA